MNDSEIVAGIISRDQCALSEAGKRYGAYLMKIASNILGSGEDAEECVNDALNKAWELIPSFRPERLSTFLGKLTRNIAINARDRKRAAKRGGGEAEAALHELSELVSGSDGPEDELMRKETLAAINEFLTRQSRENRNCFLLRYWYFEPIAAIAKRLGRSENSVKVKLHRMRNALKKYLNEREISV